MGKRDRAILPLSCFREVNTGAYRNFHSQLLPEGDGKGAAFPRGTPVSYTHLGTGTYYEGGESYEFSASGVTELNLYALWKTDSNQNGLADEEETKYTVTYTDGVDGEELFTDQTTTCLLYTS